MSDGDAPERGDGSKPDNEKFVETAYQPRESSAPSQSNLNAVGKPKDALIGTTVSGYIVKGKIGSGGMGIVYEGEQPVIGKRVAIKVLRPEIAENPEQVKRLVEEARAVNTVGHRGIIDVFGFGEVSDGRQCIVMEFLDGEALMDLLARNQKEHRAMPIAEVMVILEEILSALGAAHGAGVIHRDLKPSNIFLCRQRDGTRYVKILDFGIAKLGVHGTTPQTHASMLVGTPSYMAPEQARGGMISPSLDLYAVGVIAFEMITGQLPFLGNSVVEVLMKHAEEPPAKPSTLLMSIPDDVDELILRLLAKKPADRYPTAEAVRIDVVRIRKGLMDSTARRTELDLELDKRLKKQLQTMIVPDSGAIDFGDGEDATLPPSSSKNMRRPPSAAQQMQQQASMIAPLAPDTIARPLEELYLDATGPSIRKDVLSTQSGTERLPRAMFAPTPEEEAPAKSNGPMLIALAVIGVIAFAGILYLTRDTTPTVVELPVPELKPPPREVKPPEPVVVKPVEPEPVVAKPIEPEPVAVEPVVAKPVEPVVAKPTEPVVAKPTEPKAPVVAKVKKDNLVERFTKIEAALAKRSDKETELKTARKFLEKLKAGTVTPEQRDQVELAAKRLEDSLKE